MADLNIAPQSGPFSSALIPQSDPMQSNTGYESKTGAVFGLASKFLQGLAQGRVMKYAREQEKTQRTFQVLGAHVQSYLSDPNIDQETKSKVGSKYFEILTKGTLDQLGESTKGKDSKESVGGKLAHGAKSLLEAFSGGQLKPEKVNVGDVTDLMGMMQEGLKPEHGVQNYIDAAQAGMRKAADELARKGTAPTQEELRQHPGFQQAIGQLQHYAPDRADKIIKDFVEGYQKAPARGSKEAVVDEAMRGGGTAAPPAGSGEPPAGGGTAAPPRPSVMRKDYQPPVAKGEDAKKIGNRDLLVMQELGLVGTPIIRVFNGKPEQVVAVKGGYKDISGGTYTLDGRRLDGAGEEYKAPPNKPLVWTKDGDHKIGWDRDPLTGKLTKAMVDGQQIKSDDTKAAAKLTIEDKAGVKRFMLQGKDGKFSPALDANGKELVSFDSQSKNWQRQHAELQKEITRHYDAYTKADQALEKEASDKLLRIENMKGDGGNPLPEKDKQALRDKLSKDISARRKRLKDNTEMVMNGVAASAGMPTWKAFATDDQLDESTDRDAETESGTAWTDEDISALRDR